MARQSVAPDGQLTVMTVNLCVLAPGLTNRRLPQSLYAATLGLVIVPGLAKLWQLGAISPLSALLALPLAGLVMMTLGLPLARLLSPVLRLLGQNDFKNERIDLFLRALTERAEWSTVDVICVQECYNCLFWPGGYPERLVEGAKAHGFNFSMVPSRVPNFPATLALNTGLVILSRVPIQSSSVKVFGWSLESFSVNRAAMHVKLQDGTHIFTCHVSPSAGVGGKGGEMVARWVDAARWQNVEDLIEFVRDRAGPDAPLVFAGDFNMSVDFDSFKAAPKVDDFPRRVVASLRDRCGMLEASSAIRDPDGTSGVMAMCKPTFGYTGDTHEPAECRLSTYGRGVLHYACDDAVFYRGFAGVGFSEDSMLIPEAERPHPTLTHMSDHWALRLVLQRQRASGEREQAIASSSSHRDSPLIRRART